MNKPSNITNNDWKLLSEIYKDKEQYLKNMLKKNYPIQYLIGYVNFYGIKINVNKFVLIPRFETELLVDKTINYIKELNINNPTILDMGTGSGCIAIALKQNIPNSNITAIDISSKALSIAKDNANQNKQNIIFKKENIIKLKKLSYYDVIISNPPYIAFGEVVDIQTKYEPRKALYADNEGLLFYQQILEKADQNTKLIALEIGETQGESIAKIAKERFPMAKVIIEKDFTNRDRFIFIINIKGEI